MATPSGEPPDAHFFDIRITDTTRQGSRQIVDSLFKLPTNFLAAADLGSDFVCGKERIWVASGCS